MSKYGVIWKYQLKWLLRNRLLMTGLVFLVVAGIYGAHYGNNFVNRQKAIIHTVDTAHHRQIDRVAEMIKKENGYSSSRNAYRPPYAGSQMFYYTPSAFASLSIGQKDNLPFYHEVGGFFSDIFSTTTTAIQNPVKLLAGNFDLSFVIVYLFPLFIIVLGYNVLSEEKEQGTYTLLKTQGRAGKVILQKFLFRLALMSVVSILINIICFAMNGISFLRHYTEMLSWITITVFYIVFWFSLVYLVVSFNQSGAVTALTLGGLWVVLLLLIPGMVHRLVTDTHEKELVRSMFNSRGDYPKAWWMEQEVLKDSFSRLQHPYPLPPMNDTSAEAQMTYRNIMAAEIQKRFDNSLGRLALESQAKEYERTLRYNWINPVFTIQHAYNQLAATEINNYHGYLLSVEAQETRRRYLLNAYGLSGKRFGLKDFKAVNAYRFSQPVVGMLQATRLILPVLLMTLLLMFLGCIRFLRSRDAS